MKLGPITKPDKRNKITSKKNFDDVMSENCDVIVIFPIYGQFGAIRKPDSGGIVYKKYYFINSNLLSSKSSNRTKKYLIQLSSYCFDQKYYFCQKMLIFCKRRC